MKRIVGSGIFLGIVAAAWAQTLPAPDSIDLAEARKRGVAVEQIQLERMLNQERAKNAALVKQVEEAAERNIAEKQQVADLAKQLSEEQTKNKALRELLAKMPPAAAPAAPASAPADRNYELKAGMTLKEAMNIIPGTWSEQTDNNGVKTFAVYWEILVPQPPVGRIYVAPVTDAKQVAAVRVSNDQIVSWTLDLYALKHITPPTYTRTR
jgi:hypothetical protein